MRFSVITALCAAPLALAGSLQVDLVARGVVGKESVSEVSQQKSSDSKSSDVKQSTNSKSGDNNLGGTFVQSVQEEVVIIWFNAGNNAATSTVTNTVTVTAAGAAGGAAVAAATHAVCPLQRSLKIGTNIDRLPLVDLQVSSMSLTPLRPLWEIW